MAAKIDRERTQQIRERIKRWDNDWRFNKEQFQEFMSFVMGSQWTEDESKLFIDYKKIPLSFNKLAPLVNHLIGEQRQNTPNLQVVPLEDDIPLETAKMREALVKEISLNSDAKVIYQKAFQDAAIGGFGAFLVDTEYENEYSFNLQIKLRYVKDPTLCYWDVSAQNPSKTDGTFAGMRFRMSRKSFAAKYGDEIERSIGADANQDEASSTDWIFSNDNEITVIRDFEATYKNEKIYQLSNGVVIDSKTKNKLPKSNFEGKKFYIYQGQFVEIVNEREVMKSTITCRVCAGDYVLEEKEFPCEQLPLVFVDQNSYIEKSGKQICRPFVKDARDAQRYLNYLGTQSAYIMRVTRYDQFLVSKANVRSPDTQTIWRDPSTAQGGLIYDESANGDKPQQLVPPELSNSLLTQYQRALADIEQCTGMYGTQLGEQGNETSGKAIDARTQRGNYNTYVIFDSLNRAITCAGQVINEMIPHIYDVERAVTLNLSDKGQQAVTLNKQIDEYGAQFENDMTIGKYQVRLLPGPSFEGQKQEMLESLQMIIQADPSLFRLFADLYVESLPASNIIEIKNRLRTIVPPEIIEAGKTGEPPPPKPEQPPPEVMIKMQQLQLKQQEMQMKNQQFIMSMQLQIKEIELKERELHLQGIETGNDISVEMQKLEAQKLEAAAQLQEQELRYQAEMQRMSADMQISHADNIVKLLTHKNESKKNPKTERNDLND